MGHRVYDSSATLLVFPPTFKDAVKPASSRSSDDITEMMPRALPVEAYKAIALSSPLLSQVVAKLHLEKCDVESLRSSLEVELVQLGSRGAMGTSYAQTFIFHAKAQSPEIAAKTAQVWAEVFKEQVDGVAARGAHESFGLLDSLHAATKAELEQAETALVEQKKKWNVDLYRAEIDAKRWQLTEFEGNLKQVEVDLAAEETRLQSLTEELAKEPQKNTYFRAPSDDAYWLADKGNGPAVTEPEKGLRTEEVNSNYVELRKREIESKGSAAELRARKDALVSKLDELQKEIASLTETLVDKALEQDRFTRDVDNLKTSYGMVRADYEKGRMADQTQASDIQIAGNAVVPSKPSSGSRSLKVIMAAFMGMMVTGGFLLFKELSELPTARGANSGA
jgi:uncharacterized protein involved in exopolysaccharide biosynthesis